MPIDDLIKTMMQEFREIVKTETVVGDPVVAGDVIIVPVSKISFGFGAGGGESGKKGGSRGTGGGGSVQPVAFIIIQNGKAQLVPLEDKGMSVGDLLKYAPDVIKKIKEFKDKRDKKKSGEAAEPEATEED
ncbi:MAG: sporulation protein [Candidatus Latescibacteria bacterium]|jgi:sporulation protein YtfJ|nr:sporulation protein [Candidatus Latescibacterota bacterium]MBT5831368.1 sporulation protein [Candidatus Latescibacterota bacterium]